MPCRMDDMPCSSCGELSHSGPCNQKTKQKYQGFQQERQRQHDIQRFEDLQAKEKAPAYLLCEACSLLEEAKLFAKMASKELQKWFADHEKCEQHRIRYEAALKLTKREQRLLSIDIEMLKSAADREKKGK